MTEILIKPNKRIDHFAKELWEYRELFLFLAWKDILVRYKQTSIGIAWSVLRPLLTMMILTIVFGKLAKLPSDDIPYPLLVFTAMIPWQFFSNTFSVSSNSLISNVNLISKVYFPRIIIPTTAMITSLVDLLISFLLFIFLMLWFGVYPGLKFFLIPVLIIFAGITSLGAGYWVAALNVKYRDFRIIVPFIVQLGLYVSPIGFSSNIIPNKWRFIYSLNPIVGMIDGFRWVLLGDSVRIYFPGIVVSVIFSVLLFISGVVFFNKTERKFADII
jgi:lipopolysaccharide transport system permease protein